MSVVRHLSDSAVDCQQPDQRIQQRIKEFCGVDCQQADQSIERRSQNILLRVLPGVEIYRNPSHMPDITCAHVVGCDLAMADYTYGVPDGPLETKRLISALLDISDRARDEFPRSSPEAQGLQALIGYQAARLIMKELPVLALCLLQSQGLASSFPDGPWGCSSISRSRAVG